MRMYIIYAPKTDCSLRVLARPSYKTAVARDKTAVASDKIAVYAQNSLENFPHISCSRQKVVRLFQKWYDFSESPTTFSHISCSHCHISCSHRRISCSRRKERPSRAREPLPPLAPWLRRISFCLRSIGGCGVLLL